MLSTSYPPRTTALIRRTMSPQERFVAKLVAIMPGQIPSIPRPFVGAAATAAVAVPCSSWTGCAPTELIRPPTNSGWLSSSLESISASFGLEAVTAGGSSPSSTTAGRHLVLLVNGSSPVARGRLRMFGSANLSRPRRRSAAANARAVRRGTTWAPTDPTGRAR